MGLGAEGARLSYEELKAQLLAHFQGEADAKVTELEALTCH